MQELRFTYSDVVTLIAFILSLGSLWELRREIKKPREEESRMVREHHRILTMRKDEIRRVEHKCDLALHADFQILDYLQKEQAEEITKALQDLQQGLIDGEEVNL